MADGSGVAETRQPTGVGVGDAPTETTVFVMVPLIGTVVDASTVVFASCASPSYVSVTCVGPVAAGPLSWVEDSVVSCPIFPFRSLSIVESVIVSALPAELT